MERSLSKIKDVDEKILNELDDKSLLQFCKTHQYSNEICSNEDFWRRRLFTKYGRVEKNKDRKWKDFYLMIAYYTNEFADQALKHASYRGIKNIDVIKFFILRDPSTENLNSALISAAAIGDKDLLDYLIYRGAKDTISAYMTASMNKKRALAKHLREKYGAM